MGDQNGNVHLYNLDGLGRVNDDSVITLGQGVDGSVLLIQISYEIRGMISLVTSFADLAGTSPVKSKTKWSF
jgi:hypothetical protein